MAGAWHASFAAAVTFIMSLASAMTVEPLPEKSKGLGSQMG
jgi:hypothetical protein